MNFSLWSVSIILLSYITINLLYYIGQKCFLSTFEVLVFPKNFYRKCQCFVKITTSFPQLLMHCFNGTSYLPSSLFVLTSTINIDAEGLDYCSCQTDFVSIDLMFGVISTDPVFLLLCECLLIIMFILVFFIHEYLEKLYQNWKIFLIFLYFLHFKKTSPLEILEKYLLPTVFLKATHNYVDLFSCVLITSRGNRIYQIVIISLNEFYFNG